MKTQRNKQICILSTQLEPLTKCYPHQSINTIDQLGNDCEEIDMHKMVGLSALLEQAVMQGVC